MSEDNDLPVIQKFWIGLIWVVSPWISVGILDPKTMESGVDSWNILYLPFMSIGAWIGRLSCAGYWGPKGQIGWLPEHMVLGLICLFPLAAAHIWLFRTWHPLAGVCTFALAILCLTQLYWTAY